MQRSEQKRPRVKKHQDYLKYNFTEQEITDIAKELARENQNHAQIEQRKKEVMAEFKSQIEAAMSKIGRASALVNNGYEYRNIDCETRYHAPKENWCMTIRTDTGEIVKERKMTPEEMQEAFDFEADE